jgi:hypothetical protein
MNGENLKWEFLTRLVLFGCGRLIKGLRAALILFRLTIIHHPLFVRRTNQEKERVLSASLHTTLEDGDPSEDRCGITTSSKHLKTRLDMHRTGLQDQVHLHPLRMAPMGGGRPRSH